VATQNIREVVEGIQYQGADEVIVYTVNMAAIGTPTSPAVVVKDSTGTAVTATVMPVNSPTVATTIITLSPLRSLTADMLYRVEVACTISGNTIETYFYVRGQM
jgi:hypothetical protein